MKTLRAILAFGMILGGASQADTIKYHKLDEGSIALSPVSAEHNYEVRLQYPRCPRGAMCMPAKVLDLDMLFTLGGCMDQMGPVEVAHSYDSTTKTVNVFVSAYNIHNERSTRVHCFVMPTAKVNRKLYIGGPGTRVDNVNVRYMGVRHIIRPPVRTFDDATIVDLNTESVAE